MPNNTFSGVPGDSKCECSDSGCTVHRRVSNCRNVATIILYRIDMEDNTGTAFCPECAEDAFDSGLFTDSIEQDEPDDNEANWPSAEQVLSNSDADYRDKD